ncbi:MAG: 16S rRNA (guanine(527)-N(7))-methyltransferase RsmG [Phycisphaerales bacterium]
MPAPVPEMPESVAQSLRAQGIELEEREPAQLRAYLQSLLEANERFNLTAVTDPAQAWERHIQDSLTLVPFLASSGAQRVIDVGSGGGLPGMPLAIAMPAVRFTLLEATGKKAQFLRETAQALGLENVEVLQERAETAGQDHHAHRAKYDAVVSRAVGRLSVLAELTVPFAKEGGHILAIKGEQAAAEVEEARAALHKLHTHFVDLHRTPTGTVVVLEKTRPTPRVYPRLPGEPKRKPL